MRDVAIISARQAAEMIPSGVTVCSQGMESSGVAEEILIEIEKRFLETGRPCGLTWIHSAGQGDRRETGMNHLAHEGLLACIIGGHFGPMPKLQELILRNQVEAYNFPIGVISHMLRDMAANRPTVTRIGLGTYVDPEQEGGRLNACSKENFVEKVVLDGEHYLHYRHLKKPTFAILRGSFADTKGNISCEEEPCYAESLQVAQTVHRNGGKVFVQVKAVVEHGSLDARRIRIPGTIVDYVIPVSDLQYHKMTTFRDFEPSLCGAQRVYLKQENQSSALDERRIIGRRAAMELRSGAVINLGVGIPQGVSAVVAEEGVSEEVTLSLESGLIGGIPLSGSEFGAAFNPECMLDQPEQFDSYDGGGLDIAFLGLAEADRCGNVNVSRFGDRVTGAGGFINITQATPCVVFCGTMTAGGLSVQVRDGVLHILQEGRVRKLVSSVQQITFSGAYAAASGQRVLYITERAVFQLSDGELVLTEIAPGADLERDVLSQMDFRPRIADEMKIMDARIFREGNMGLREMLQ